MLAACLILLVLSIVAMIEGGCRNHVYLIKHAQAFWMFNDGPLTRIGVVQSQRVADMMRKPFLGKKKRSAYVAHSYAANQTLQHIMARANLQIDWHEDELLDRMGAQDPLTCLQRGNAVMNKFFDCKMHNQQTVLVTHGSVINCVRYAATGEFERLKNYMMAKDQMSHGMMLHFIVDGKLLKKPKIRMDTLAAWKSDMSMRDIRTHASIQVFNNSMMDSFAEQLHSATYADCRKMRMIQLTNQMRDAMMETEFKSITNYGWKRLFRYNNHVCKQICKGWHQLRIEVRPQSSR